MNNKRWNRILYSFEYFDFPRIVKVFELLNGAEKNVKEYIDDKLIFEGEYKNGKRWNGKGQEFNKGNQLIYDGEYLAGKRHGKGKEYYNNYKIFDGEYQNGQRKKGKEYYYNYYNDHQLNYEGEYSKGLKWNGKGYNIKGELIFEIENDNGKGKYSNMIIYYLKVKF